MSEATEYRANAQLCADIAESTTSPLDREIWFRMQRSWLELASKQEQAETLSEAA